MQGLVQNHSLGECVFKNTNDQILEADDFHLEKKVNHQEDENEIKKIKNESTKVSPSRKGQLFLHKYPSQPKLKAIP